MSEETPAAPAAPAEAPASAPAEGVAAEALSQAAAVPAAPEAPAAEAPAAEQESTDPDPFEDDAVETFDRAYVEKLRKENAKYRTEAKEAKEAFSGWTPEDAAVLQNVIQIAANDPKVGAAKMREIAALLDGGDVEGAAQVAAEASEAAAEEAKALTPEDVENKVKEALDAQNKQRELEQKRDEIVNKTKELGYEPGSPDYFTLLHIAQYDAGGDLDKAHEAMEARKQAIIDEYVAGIKESAGRMPTHLRRPESSVADLTEEPKDMKDAKKRMQSRIRMSMQK